MPLHKNIVLWVGAMVLFVGCDCRQKATGIILDKQTNEPICNVVIGKFEKEALNNPFTSREYSDTTGRFRYEGISGGFFRCPVLTLHFSKEGYVPKQFKYDCSSCGSDTIFLEKVK